MALSDLVQWLCSTEALLSPGTTMACVQQQQEELPAAFADYDGPERMGRICGWVNGCFDFEIIRHRDAALVFFLHVQAEQLSDPILHEALTAFLTALAETASGMAGGNATGIGDLSQDRRAEEMIP